MEEKNLGKQFFHQHAGRGTPPRSAFLTKKKPAVLPTRRALFKYFS